MNATTTTTDEELAVLVRTNAEYLGEIITRYESKLSAYIRRKSYATQSDIEDILQNIFIKVYTNINGFDSGLSFSAWIYRIARNETIDWYRKNGTNVPVSLDVDDSVIQTLSSELHADDRAHTSERAQTLRSAINQLSTDYQEILELRYFEEKSYDEIADILMIPPGTVAIRISRAKKQLQQLLSYEHN